MCVVKPGPVPETQMEREFVESSGNTHILHNDDDGVAKPDFPIVLVVNGRHVS